MGCDSLESIALYQVQASELSPALHWLQQTDLTLIYE